MSSRALTTCLHSYSPHECSFGSLSHFLHLFLSEVPHPALDAIPTPDTCYISPDLLYLCSGLILSSSFVLKATRILPPFSIVSLCFGRSIIPHPPHPAETTGFAINRSRGFLYCAPPRGSLPSLFFLIHFIPPPSPCSSVWMASLRRSVRVSGRGSGSGDKKRNGKNGGDREKASGQPTSRALLTRRSLRHGSISKGKAHVYKDKDKEQEDTKNDKAAATEDDAESEDEKNQGSETSSRRPTILSNNTPNAASAAPLRRSARQIQLQRSLTTSSVSGATATASASSSFMVVIPVRPTGGGGNITAEGPAKHSSTTAAGNAGSGGEKTENPAPGSTTGTRRRSSRAATTAAIAGGKGSHASGKREKKGGGSSSSSG